VIRLLSLLIFLVAPLPAGVREEALRLATKAGETFESDPAAASQFAEEAYKLLATDQTIAPTDRAACAGLTARAARLAGDEERARLWFQKTLTHAAPEGATAIRAELADMLMRSGDLPAAREALGPVPLLKSPSPLLAQWYQTSAKLHLTCGLPGKAQTAIRAALAALPSDDLENQIALAIDAAGIALRLGQPVGELIEEAGKKLRSLEEPAPEFITALTAIAAQAPGLTPDASFSLLRSVELNSLPGDTRLSYSVTLAEAALKNDKRDFAKETLDPVIASDALPDDHPLLARALALHAEASGDPASAIRSSEVALRWLENSQDSNLLLGLQRTVDPLSPLIKHAPETLPATALAAQNFALRQRLGGTVSKPTRQTVLYLLYEKNFVQHYGALVFKPDPVWLPLGPAEKIHQRVIDTVETAERTLAEVNTGATLSVRLTQLWKSLWAPLSEHLDPNQAIDIAPVGMLHAVPWAILRQRDGRYLCQVLAEVHILALTGKFPPREPSQSLTVVGIQSAPGELPSSGSFPFDDELSRLISKLPALPGVASETSRLGGNLHLNPDREKFLALLAPHQGTLHLAGHGFVIESEEGHGFRAGLVLHGGGRENLLFAREIAALNLSSTNLVVLSACRGGIGVGEVGGNWSSLRRAFIAAGARNVLAAQWRVRDDHLPDFMEAFHENLKASTPSQALWSLQKSLVTEANEIDLASVGAWVMETVPDND
jgi:CHAT domain-containing protein